MTRKVFPVPAFRCRLSVVFTTVDGKRQKDHVFSANLGYTVGFCHKQQTCMCIYVLIYMYSHMYGKFVKIYSGISLLTQFQFYIIKNF